MAKLNVSLQHFATGVIDTSVLPRVDLAYMRLAAEDQTNIMALTSGKGFVRPGLQYLGSTKSDAAARIRAFNYSETAAALLEFSDLLLRVQLSDTMLTRSSVSTTISNGTFSSSTGWTDSSTGGGTLTFGGSGLVLNGVNRGGIAKCTRTIAVAGGDQNTEHGLRIVVGRGPVTFRCGSTSGGDELVSETTLGTGTHSLAFIPGGANFYLQIQNTLDIDRIVTSIAVEAAGIVELPTIYPIASVPLIRLAQSNDVAFLACDGYRQQRVERRGDGASVGRSWSIVNYMVDDGPFLAATTNVISLKPGASHGNTTLTASAPLFKSTHVGAIFRLFHSGYRGTFLLGAEDQYTDTIRVTGIFTNGVSSDRNWSFTTTGTWVGTVTVQRSFDGPDSGFHDYRISQSTANTTFTTNQTGNTEEDTESNSIIYYRMGFKPGNYTSGAISIVYSYDGGGDYGICRVTAYNSPTSVNIEILRPFTDVVATKNWREGMWSDHKGWPSAVGFFDGRLWWAGSNNIWGSISDAYGSFDEAVTGDSGPVSRAIATGGINKAKWILSLQRMIFGTDGSETSARSSSLDEPITPTNLTLRDASSVGSAGVAPAKIDARGLFVDKSGRRLYELTFDAQSYDYHSTPLSRLVASWFDGGVREMAIQRRPDTRIWIVMEDGTAMVLIYDQAQGPEPGMPMAAFIPIETNGTFESVEVLPGTQQDLVYFVVNRTINGSTKRFREKMALDSETTPDTLCKCMDAFTTGTQAASTTVPVGSHLNGAQVVAWADGVAYPGPYTVSGGNITLPTAVANWAAGLSFDWRYKSSRLAYGAQGGTALLMPKKIDHIGAIATNFHRSGLKYGKDFTTMYPFPAFSREGQPKDTIVLDDVSDEDVVEFGGDWDTDSRICIKGSSPYPAHLLGLVFTITTNERG